MVESFNACSSCFPSRNSLDTGVKTNRDMKVVGEFDDHIDLLMVWDLSKVKIMSQKHIRSVMGKEFCATRGKERSCC